MGWECSHWRLRGGRGWRGLLFQGFLKKKKIDSVKSLLKCHSNSFEWPQACVTRIRGHVEVTNRKRRGGVNGCRHRQSYSFKQKKKCIHIGIFLWNDLYFQQLWLVALFLSGCPFDLTRYNVQWLLYNRIKMHGTYLVYCEYRIGF